MTTAEDLRADSRAELRSRVRDLALDSTRRVVLDVGWASVRMGSVAREVGVSRQTLHNEFGTKEDLGLALVGREAQAYFADVATRLDQHPGDLPGAVRDAAQHTLETTADNPFLQAVLTGTASGDTSLLPLLTSRSEPLLHDAVALFGAWVRAQWPDLDDDRARIGVEAVVRLLLSHVITPTAPPADVARDLAEVATRVMFGDGTRTRA
ncbi:TetR/AcrR family transcriptional regulator [Nocardioides bruguierae]|uniref:TetR/AcrR family transcriptional regulator n=1 Tax=Nocardioides bruguierae TaxID=2945102 RepID=UPI0020217B46|nr:TetR family transcriptional regulator [Nocardioides bruguierae]MCL8025765.1 TetR family transcriptional regulator [Nocardioides bruguierae]